MLSSAHPPDDDRIYFKEARSLSRFGAAVTIVCPAGPSAPEQPGSVRFKRFEARPHLWSRALRVRLLAALAADLVPDVIHCHEPDSLLAALAAGRRLACPVIYDSHELWSGVAADRFAVRGGSVLLRLFQAAEGRFVRRCAATIGATPGISRFLASRIGADRVETILNVPDDGVFGECRRARRGGKIVFCHEGHLTFARGLKELVQAVHIVSGRHEVELRIVGDVFGAERRWLESYVERNRLAGLITRTGWLPYGDVGSALAACDVGVVSFERNFNHEIAAPNKIFNYLYAGLPIVGPSFMEVLEEMSRRDGTCLLAETSDPSALAAAENLVQQTPQHPVGELAVGWPQEAQGWRGCPNGRTGSPRRGTSGATWSPGCWAYTPASCHRRATAGSDETSLGPRRETGCLIPIGGRHEQLLARRPADLRAHPVPRVAYQRVADQYEATAPPTAPFAPVPPV
jgi:glycosyltransferase involved in cell wall biosynthesis